MIIRPAHENDSIQLAELAERTFREAFSEHNSTENMQLHCDASYSESIQAKEINDSNVVTLVAESEQKLIAYAQLYWDKPPKCIRDRDAGEIRRLYVAREWHGKGLAQRLMNACLEVFKEQRNETVWLGVWERNPRAIAYYKKFKFREVGEHIFPVGDDPQRDIIMELTISSLSGVK